jgi:hypothetical protein
MFEMNGQNRTGLAASRVRGQGFCSDIAVVSFSKKPRLGTKHE